MNHNINPALGMTQQQITQHANNMYNQQYAQYAQQGVNSQLANTPQIYHHPQIYHLGRYTQHMWMWNGVDMDIVDFAEHAYGDTPERTAFLLKYTKEK